MKFSKSLHVVLALTATLAAGSLSCSAQNWGRHPAYLHALSDLRLMRAYLDRLTPNERIDDASQRAIDEIDGAIREIKMASFDDGKDLRDHMPIDARIEPADRFHRAREAGRAAMDDINREEDNDFARGLKHRALDHIDRANQIVDHILEHIDQRFGQRGEGGGYRGEGNNNYGNNGGGSAQPAPSVPASFVRALSSLRMMRALLDHTPSDGRTDGEMQTAIDEIDAVLRDFQHFSVSDGRDFHDHAPFDMRLHRAERLHMARDAGNAAWGEIDREHDFAFGDGLKHHSMDHIERANHTIDHILEQIGRR